jgi:hypothetical protein
MGNNPDGLIISQAQDRAAIDNVEDASFRPRCRVGRLVQNAPHVAVAIRRSVAVVHACALFVAGQAPTHEARHFSEGKRRCSGADFGNDLLRSSRHKLHLPKPRRLL